MVMACFRMGLGVKATMEADGIVRPDEPDQLVDDLRKFIIQLLSQQSSQKSHPFQKAIHIRVGGVAAQHGSHCRVGFRKVRAQLL
jgi:hypothetical protein